MNFEASPSDGAAAIFRKASGLQTRLLTRRGRPLPTPKSMQQKIWHDPTALRRKQL
jgi:hypothetical protein